MGIDVSAPGTFDGMPLQVFAQQKSLHFSQFKRAKDTTQSSNASPVAASLFQYLFDQAVAAIALPPLQDRLRVLANLVVSNVPHVCMKATDQRLTDIGMKLGLEQRQVSILAGENPSLEHTFLEQGFQRLRHLLEMLARFVLDAALCVASVISGKSIAATSARHGMEQVFALG